MPTTTKSMYEPSHPGEILLEMYLKPLDVGISEAAEALGVTRKHVSSIVHGRAPISADMAVKLAAAFGTEAEFWMNLQAQHDLWVVRNKAGKPKVKSFVGRKAA
jgi:antitoxin HigA-1